MRLADTQRLLRRALPETLRVLLACRSFALSKIRLDPDQFSLNFSGHPGLARGGHHVHLAAHAELRQIDSGLDREAGMGQKRRSSWVSRLSRCAPDPCSSWAMLWPVRCVKNSPNPPCESPRAPRRRPRSRRSGGPRAKALLDGLESRRRAHCARFQRPVARVRKARGPPRPSR